MQTRYGDVGESHKAALSKGPEHFKKFFLLTTAAHHCTNLRQGRQSRQLMDIRNEHFLEIEKRSALGVIWTYNRLPPDIALHNTIKEFQTSLQHLLKDRVEAGCPDCMITLSPRVPVYCHPLKWYLYRPRIASSIYIYYSHCGLARCSLACIMVVDRLVCLLSPSLFHCN